MHLVLHPRLKLEYFRQHEWEKEWVEHAEKMVHEEYTANYEKAAASEEISIEALPVQVCGMPSCSFSNSLILIQGNEGILLFANFSIGASAATTLSEVNKYLSCPVENIVDPLKWWTDNCKVYPNLSSMALDYLCIPYK